MRYNKPELVVLTRAVDLIEGISKPDLHPDNRDPSLGQATTAAYEADE